MAAAAPRPELLVIVGQTASGKSELALKVAKHFDGEIITADSWTVYRGFDIGTSKPSKKEQIKVRHHLLDIAEPNDGFNAPKFKQLAESAIKEIQNRGKLPIMAGGTGLYIDSVLFDFGFLADVSPHERERLNALSIPELVELALAQKINLDGVDLRNRRRIIRAIEAKGQKPSKKELKSGVLMVGLQLPPETLRQRVEIRVVRMINAGLEAEVKELSGKYGWDIEPMKGIGYRQWREYFEGSQSLEQTQNRIVSATMGLAKRQRTWFKRNPHAKWFASPDAAFEYISRSL